MSYPFAHFPVRHLDMRASTATKHPAPLVLVYRSDILPQSETFIKEQMLAYRNWRGLLIGRHLLHQLSLDGLEINLLAKGGPKARVLQRFGLGLGALRKMRPRLLHAHFGPEAVTAAPLGRALRLPMLVTLHGYDINIDREWWENGYGGEAMRSYPRRLLELAARPYIHFTAVSHALRSRAIAFGIPPQKVTVNYIGVDTDKFVPGPTPLYERSPRVLFVGRLVEKKGCEFLLRAMQIVRRHVPGAELAIIGDGPLRAELEILAGTFGGHTRFCGALPPHGVKRELDNTRVFCLPSIRAANGDAEGFGLVLLEAQAAGVPVVSSAFGGAREGILHEQSGYCFAEKDIDALSKHLTDLLIHPDRAAAMGLAARRFVSAAFNIRKCTETLEHLYSQITGFQENDSPDHDRPL
jgi:glycosyltransferase involved in cell wall biosynthesis